ncbi:hypothetical protein CLV67_12790 [Actinoplanes italicus]|uniref:Uncharacterized protein n=1 Tax=Actinoplanes italicus TaxID=113567 RepID=A0A2T0JXD4_9ACTN|nr:hypothetical protein CLV67_12790 [Actinoplanes italicus]
MYRLTAVIAEAGLLRERVTELSHGVLAVLRCGLAMVPVNEPDRALVEERLAEWSTAGVLAFVEADFFGGDGHQTATVWRDGALAWGPVVDDRFDGPREQWPINAALAQLGVRPSGGPRDLFDQVGLGIERDVADWLAYARAGLTPEHLEAQARERELARTPADLDGRAIMALLDIPPGPSVGAATRRLRQLRLERGPLPREEAESELREWAFEQGIRRTLDVDGHLFAVRANASGGTDYTWLDGPDPGYGFTSSAATTGLTVDGHRASIRAFLAAVDPATGHVDDA